MANIKTHTFTALSQSFHYKMKWGNLWGELTVDFRLLELFSIKRRAETHYKFISRNALFQSVFSSHSNLIVFEQQSFLNVSRAPRQRGIQGTDSNISIGAAGVTGSKSEAYVLGCVSHIVSVCWRGGSGGCSRMLEREQQLHSG